MLARDKQAMLILPIPQLQRKITVVNSVPGLDLTLTHKMPLQLISSTYYKFVLHLLVLHLGRALALETSAEYGTAVCIHI